MAILIKDVVSHWSHNYLSLNLSSDKFYQHAELLLRQQNLPNTSILRITHKEGGMFSASREYLRVFHYDLVFDICAAPYGNTYYISWWLFRSEGCLMALLKLFNIGGVFSRSTKYRTMHQVDTESMFLCCVHQCILQTIHDLIESEQYPLSDSDKRYHILGL